jgi:DNA-binding MarR family transcriptional regulator
MLLRGLRAASRKATALYDEALAPVDLNIAQFSLLRKIERAGTVFLTALGRLAELDRSTVGRNIKSWNVCDLSDWPTCADRRKVMVTLAPSGVEALRRAGPLWEAAQCRVEDGLGVERARRLRALALAAIAKKFNIRIIRPPLLGDKH